MSEKASLFQVGSTLGTGDIPGTSDPAHPRSTTRDWERVLWGKTAPALQQPIEEARPFGRRENTPTFLKWMRLFWMRRWGKRKAENIRQDIHETGNNAQAFMTMAQYAINLAVKSEPEASAQLAKRRLLMDRWRGTYARVFNRNSPL